MDTETEITMWSFKTDKQTLKRLRELAEKQDRSASAVVRVLINEAWEREFKPEPQHEQQPS